MVYDTDLLHFSNMTGGPFKATFNSIVIESMLHNIPTISSPFMYTQV